MGVRGGGRKPFKQKGTGRARQGSIRSPLKVGGGVSFGPKPKDWANKKMNRKEAELAIIAIQNKASRVTVVDSIAGKFSEPKTKNVVSMLSGLGLDADAKTVLVYDQEDEPPPGRDHGLGHALGGPGPHDAAGLRLGQRALRGVDSRSCINTLPLLLHLGARSTATPTSRRWRAGGRCEFT